MSEINAYSILDVKIRKSTIPHDRMVLHACIKIRRHANAESESFLSEKPFRFCSGGPSLFYFTTSISSDTLIFCFRMGLFLVLCGQLWLTYLPLFIDMAVPIVRPLDCISVYS